LLIKKFQKFLKNLLKTLAFYLKMVYIDNRHAQKFGVTKYNNLINFVEICKNFKNFQKKLKKV